MVHDASRIREAMRPNVVTPLGSNGGTVEADETFIGKNKDAKIGKQTPTCGFHHKNKIPSLVDRQTGRARSPRR